MFNYFTKLHKKRNNPNMQPVPLSNRKFFGSYNSVSLLSESSRHSSCTPPFIHPL